MNIHDLVYGESLFMLNIMCDNEISWTQNTYFQHSCLVTGKVYPIDFCCYSKEGYSTIPSYAPIGIPSTDLSHLQSTYLYHNPTISDSWDPNQHQSFDPSQTPSKTTTIPPSAVQHGKPYIHPKNALSSSFSVFPSKESSNVPSFIPSYS